MAFLIDRNTADQRRQYDGYVAWIGINISSLYLFVNRTATKLRDQNTD